MATYCLKDLTKEQTYQAIIREHGKKESVSDKDFEEMYSIIGGRPGHLIELIHAITKHDKNISTEAKKKVNIYKRVSDDNCHW